MTFGQYLRQLRKAKGLTLVQLSERTAHNVVTVSQSFLSQVERGQFTPSTEVLKSLSLALNVSYIGMLIKAGHVTEEEVLTYREQNGVYKH